MLGCEAALSSLPSHDMSTKRETPVTRQEYLIDRYLVVLDSNGGRHCSCGEFHLTGECRHTRESEGRRLAQELIAKRVRSVHGTLIGFGHSTAHNEARRSKRERTRSLSIVRVR